MKKLGRAFNHLEDLVFFYGSDGIREAINHIEEICEDSSSIRMKWDGGLQIYWGREYINGPLILTGHNGWARGSKSTTPEELYDFIVNQSGKDREKPSEERKQFANQFSSLFPVFDAATPVDFVGFVYADALFLSKPTLSDGEYKFQPNHTGYAVHKDTKLGNKIANSGILLAGHAYFEAFGSKDDKQVPLDNFDMFNNTTDLTIVNPYYSNVSVHIDLDQHKQKLIEYLPQIDEFLAPIAKVSSFREYIYKYINFKMKNKSDIPFLCWLRQRKSACYGNQKMKIEDRVDDCYIGFIHTMYAIDVIMCIKNNIIEQLEQNKREVIAYNPEGWVRYADDTKKFGNIKLVPRHRWTP